MSKKVFAVIGVLAIATFFLSLVLKNYGYMLFPSMGEKVLYSDLSYQEPVRVDWIEPAATPATPMVTTPMAGGVGMGTSANMATEDSFATREYVDMGYPAYGYSPYTYISSGDALGLDNRIYLKSAYHSVVVNDISGYTNQLKEYFLSLDGRILSTSINQMDRYQVANITAKIPVDRFDEAAAKVTSGVKKVVSENISSQDITGEVVAQDDEITRIQGEIDKKEADLAELTENTAEWRRIRTQIENLEAQLARISKSTENFKENVMYATLSVSAADNERYFKGGYGYQPGIPEIFDKAWWSAKGNLGHILSAVVWIVVYSIFWAPIVLLIWWLKRRKISTKKA